jgi:hypothetical protein
MEKIYLLNKHEHSEKQIAEGKGIPNEEVKKRLHKLLE